MSRNISKLSGRKGLKDNLFKRMIDTTKKTKNGKEIKQLAEEYMWVCQRFMELKVFTNF